MPARQGRRVRAFGHPLLRPRAREVEAFDEDLQHHVPQTGAPTHDALGIGLAAPHVGIGPRPPVYRVLRNAGLLQPRVRPDIVVCWGGHSIGRDEYEYTKLVGYELGLRGLNVCTGCGPGAMKGPMKGATIGHAKQRIPSGRYIGLTEPGIVAAEPPNAIVNQLAILPDIEKRLEAFVRIGHGIVVFPGGAGTAEEILYLVGILSLIHI